MVSKKGQVSFEYINTYGWAFLALTVALGALTYFGFTDLSKFTPERCTFPAEFICDDYIISSSGVNVTFRHNLGEQVLFENATCDYSDGSTTTFVGSFFWDPKERIEIVCPSTGFVSAMKGSKEKVIISLSYRIDAGGYLRMQEGELYAEVQ